MKLGYHTGYWSAGPPAGVPEAIAQCERLGFDSDLGGRGLRVGLPDAAGLVGRLDRADPPRYEHHADVGAHAGRRGDGRDDARPPVRRPVHPRPRRVRSAGRRGLVRPALPQAPRPHPRVRRGHPQDPRPRRTGHPRRRVLPAALPGRRRPRQAAEVDRAPAAQRHPDHARRGGPEERRAVGRDRRRLAADVLLAEDGRLLPRRAGRGLRPARRPAHGRRLRGAGLRPDGRARRRRGGGQPGAAVHRALHRRHGREVDELPRQPLRPARLRGRGGEDPGAVPGRPQARGDGRGADQAGRGHRAGRPAGQDPRRAPAMDARP